MRPPVLVCGDFDGTEGVPLFSEFSELGDGSGGRGGAYQREEGSGAEEREARLEEARGGHVALSASSLLSGVLAQEFVVFLYTY